jgi:hypothetical protein
VKPPFTEDEVRSAVRLIGTEEEASNTALGFRLGMESGSGDVTQDTLILLSLVSDDLARRVDAFRDRGRQLRPPEAEALWQARREAIQRLLSDRV